MTNHVDSSERRPAVSFRDLVKEFGTNRVLNRVNLDFYPGSIHALLGANGSGKSTLIKILAGYHPLTSGQVSLNGEEIGLQLTPALVQERGVRFVHQDLGLVSSLSVADNFGLALGFQKAGPRISWRKQREEVIHDLAQVGIDDIDPATLVRDLGPIQQTLVALARATKGIIDTGGVLVLDEPTARLPNDQVSELLSRCRALRDRGVALIYVSHRLDEVFAMADTVSVLRDGNLVHSGPIGQTNQDELTSVITGFADGAEFAAQKATETSYDDTVTHQLRTSRPVLEAIGISGARVQNASLRVYPGEVLAVTGLAGSGRSELGRLLFGSQALTGGVVEFHGQPLKSITPNASVRRGIGYVPQDRKQAAIANFDLAENLTLASLEKHTSGLTLSARSQQRATEEAIGALDVRPPEPRKKISELSGGNQQKVILGKWLELELEALILDECTYGVDIGARRTIMGTIEQRVAHSGLAVLMLDSDIDLIAEHADRVLIMRAGRFVSELIGEEITVDAIAAASYATDPETATHGES